LGCDLRIALQEDFGLRSAVADIHPRVQTSLTCETRLDPDGGSLYIGRGHVSVGDSPVRNHQAVEITRVKIRLSDDERIKAYASITLDDCFIIHGFRLTYSSQKGYFLFMPGRKTAYGTYTDIVVHPLNDETRQMIQEKVVAEYEKIAAGELKTHGLK
jgi:stage V sporulation protein G